jgi:oligopeptidase B
MDRPVPPVAKRVSLRHERFGRSWVDDYAWLRDPAYPKVEDPEILAYLDAENTYFDEVMRPLEPLVQTLHAELKARLEQDDRSVPVREGSFEYHWQFAPGAQYRTWFRTPLSAPEPQVVLDETLLAEDRSFFKLGAIAPSPDGVLLAYTIDDDGSERYRLAVKSLETGAVLEHRIRDTSGAVAWSADGGTLFYVELNESLRPFRIRAHRLGAGQTLDRVVYEETDPAFFVSLGRTRDRRLILIRSGTHVTSEVRLVPADRPEDDPLVVTPRRDGHRYTVDHAHGRLWIVTNDRHANFRLAGAPADAPGEEGWEEVIPGSDERYLLGVSCFERFLVVAERINGLARIDVRTYTGEGHEIDFPEEVYTVTLGDNREFAADTIRLGYTSMVTPASVIDYRVDSRQLTVRRIREIPSGYEKSRYVTRRLMAPASDGVQVPITIVHRDDYPTDGTGRLYLYAYGAYGHGLDPAFNAHRLSLLDRGFAWALAHVRGGDEMGWRWYEDGKLDKKENSFCDFIACAEHLVHEGYGHAGGILVRGGSAGGMLVGAVVNRRPELWRCAIAEVPFVDVLNTMLDSSLPLTPIEWPEWGNPRDDAEALHRILGYSPCDNVRAQTYPAMLLTAGISDPRVTYWEPAKLAARLRATKRGDSLLLLRTNMQAGHFGRSGRFEMLREVAEQFAFVLSCYGLTMPEEAVPGPS